jgi:hypothetical protein
MQTNILSVEIRLEGFDISILELWGGLFGIGAFRRVFHNKSCLVSTILGISWMPG